MESLPDDLAVYAAGAAGPAALASAEAHLGRCAECRVPFGCSA